MVIIPNTARIELYRSIGALYHWGAGSLQDASRRWPEGPFDCSGYAQAALAALSILRVNAWNDLRAADLANECDPVSPAQAELGDLLFYGVGKITHVMVALGGGMCIGATGGGPTTRSNDPNACVQVRPNGYRRDLITAGRLKARHRRAA